MQSNRFLKNKISLKENICKLDGSDNLFPIGILKMIYDFHSDLLACVETYPEKGFFHSGFNCSLDQLKKGGVSYQAFTIFTETKPGSSKASLNQLELYRKLLRENKTFVSSQRSQQSDTPLKSILCIENLSGFFEEDDPLELGFNRIETAMDVEDLLYISLTWKTENRFGGGDLTNIGLKADGEVFLEWLNEKNIAIDLSHTSDYLADDILNFLEKKGLSLIPIASHSNFRDRQYRARNLPLTIAKEIVKKHGVIGINLVKKFIGKTIDNLLDHLEFAIDQGMENHLVFGSDFYGDLPDIDQLVLEENEETFFESFSNASTMKNLRQMIEDRFKKPFSEKICYKNAETFFNHLTGNIVCR